jgi:hypothetical protein
MSGIAPYLIAAGFALMGVLLLGSGLTLPVALRAEERPERGFGHSWVLARFGRELESVAGTIVWGLAGIGFIVAALGIVLGQQWWALGAWLGAPLTVAAIALWFGAVPSGAYIAGVMASLTIGWLVFLGR